MSFLARIREANNAQLKDYWPLFIGDDLVGLIWHAHWDMLRQDLDLRREGDICRWHPPGDLAANSALLAECAQTWLARGIIDGWRDERYAIAAGFYHTPHALLERAAMPVLGACGYGVHVNGLTRRNGETHMWLGRRAANKSTDPNKLDQIAAGGIPHGIGVFANMQKECEEEADLPLALSAHAQAVSMTSYLRQTDSGIRADVLFNYDLWLPEDFIPHNRDGEVAEFICLPMTDVMQLVENTDEVKFNSALVIIDVLVRHGYLTPEHRDYQAIAGQLNAREVRFAQWMR